jgi:hypothetical protein
MGRSIISTPFITGFLRPDDSLFNFLVHVHRILLASLITSLAGSGVITLLAIPSILFPASRLLIYTNLFLTHLSAMLAFLSALLVTGLMVGASSLVGRLGAALGLVVEQGGIVLFFLWSGWAVMTISGAYWGMVWFVEVRRWSLVKRVRIDEEIGDWRGTKGEVWADIEGKKKL